MSGAEKTSAGGTLWAPALALFVLAPLIAEYLLGSLSMRQVGILPIEAAMYGSGALVIREAARRTGRGWKTIALLGLAYGLVEEGLVDQSIFGRDFLHLRLLDYGYLPWAGTAPPWLVFVLAIHIIWSIALPIGLAEALFPARRGQAWLGPVVMSVVVLLYIAGAGMVAVSTYGMTHYSASAVQLATAALATIASIAGAFLLPRPRAIVGLQPEIAAPLAFAVAFVAGSALMGSRQIALSWGWPWAVCTAALLATSAAFLTFIFVVSRVRLVTGRTRFALIAAGLSVYAVFGFATDRELHGATDLPAHGGLVVLFVIVVAIAYQRTAMHDHGQLNPE